MRRLNFRVIALFCISFVAIAAINCSRGNRYGTTARNHGSNSDVEQMVKSKLTADPQLSAADISVSADARNNEIKLSGTVPSEELRARAISIAKSVDKSATPSRQCLVNGINVA